MERVEFLPLRGAAAGEDLRAGQRQVADAGSLAGPVAEPSGRSEGACAPLPRAFLHALARKERDRTQREACPAISGQEQLYNYYSDFAEKGYYNRIIAGNINQVLKVDSVVCDFNGYPYRAVTYATQKIIRQSNVTERSLVTTCRLLNSSRSDDNPNGFTIEGFTIIENKDLQTIKR